MVEETASEPVPPDIRPCRINHRNSKHDRAKPTSNRKPFSTSTTKHVHVQYGWTIYTTIFLFIFLINLPLTSAGHSTNNTIDPYTSYPPSIPIRSTPILNLLISGLNFFLSPFNIDTTDVRTSTKRLDQTEKIEAGMIPLLVMLSGMFAGLTLGYFSVDPTQLQVLSMSGTETQRRYARKIMPVRKDSHLLLTTLILGNMIVNEALPVVTDGVLGGGIQAVVISTALVVIFAEIIPQSVCSRYGLLIGATMAKPVRVMMWIAFPIAWPIAKLLEYILGAHHGIIYRRSELRELIKMHAAGAEGGGDLDLDTVTMAQGALDLGTKVVREAMTPIDRVFMLPIEAKLDYETLGHVVRSGHSRVPVYQMVDVPDVNLSAPGAGPTKNKLVKKVIGSLLVKSCVLLDPEDATPLATIPINAIPTVPFDEPMTNMLNVFQEGRSHMAIVSRRSRHLDAGVDDAGSVMTAAAGGLRQRFMRKVAEISQGKSPSSSSSEGGGTSGSESDSDVERAERKKKKRSKKTESHAMTNNPSEAQQIRDEVENNKKKRSITNAAKLTQLEQIVPADAQLPPGMVEKFFEGLEGAPVGIITLEDVLEELIGEEIYDEYDEHGPKNAASAFVPREAALAARKAALDRETALASTTPLPPTNDADIADQAVITSSAPTRRVVMPTIPKLPAMPKFSLGKKPTSQPGRSRNASANEPKVAQLTPNEKVSTPGVIEPSMPRTEEPVSFDFATNTPPLPPPQVEEISRPASGTNESTPNVSIASAIPARLIPATDKVAPPSNPNLLTEALLVERGRRRGIAVPGIPRAHSSTGVSRTSTPTVTPILPSSGVLSPTPIPFTRRGTKFKSVPTPIATPIPGNSGREERDPMEVIRGEEGKEV